MPNIVRVVSEDASVSCICIDSTKIVAQAEQFHKTSATVTAALGRLLTAASLMGSMLKGEQDTLTLRLAGDGPAGCLIAVGDSHGNVKGYVANPIVEIPLNQYGKLDVAGAVGKKGSLTVIKDLGLKEPYIGYVPIISGEIAEDITYYYAASEQIPTVCALGVLVNTNLTVLRAGGFIIQLLPNAKEETIKKLEENINQLDSITKMLEQNKTPKEIAFKALNGFSAQVIGESTSIYHCDCSRERVERALISLGKEELKKMAEEQETIEVDCHFCNKKYCFSCDEIYELIK